MSNQRFIHRWLIAIAVLCAGIFSACTDEFDYDSRITNLEERVSRLEQLCDEMNTNIGSLQTIVASIQQGDYITAVNPIEQGGKVIGYTISFVKGAPITIYHGQDGANGKDGNNGQDGKDGKDGSNGADGHTPVIGVRQDTDGIWYWTIDGNWLLDSNGQKVKAVGTDGKDGKDGKDGQNGADGKDGQPGADGKDGQDGQNGADGKDGQNGADGKDGVTPQLKIENGYWFVSTDNGLTWTQLGKATGENGKDGKDGADGKDGKDGKDADSMFASIDFTTSTDYVIFTLADGTVLQVPTWYAFEQLRTMVNQMNSNIEGLQTIVTALQNSNFITSVLPIIENGKEIGYIINFDNRESITIYHGKDGKDGENGADGQTPQIGIRQDTDGIWYWTLNGEWLLDEYSNKLKAVGIVGKDGQDGQDGNNGNDGQDGADGANGITPQLKIEDGYWYVSTDNGQTWTQLGKATGDNGQDGANGQDGQDGQNGQDGVSMFQSVTVGETDVTFVTADGQTFVVRRASALSIEFDSADLVVMAANSTRDIHYTITSGLEDITIETVSSEDVKAKVVKYDNKTGVIQVKTSSTIDEFSKVVVLVSNGSQAIMRTLNFEKEAIEVEENTTKEVPEAGGEVTLEFFSNTPCHAVIPDYAQSWISVVPPTKSMTKQTITLKIEESLSPARSATVFVVGDNDDSNLVLSYTISQEVGGLWKEGTVPPDNEIWYISTFGESVMIDESCFDREVLSNTYSNGRGVISFNGSVSRIGSYAFSGKGITGLFLPDSVEIIEDFGLSGTELDSLYIPKNLKQVGFMGLNTQSRTIHRYYGNNTDSMGYSVIIDNELVSFVECGVSDYSIPNGVISIGTAAFICNRDIETISFPNGLKRIACQVFEACSKLKGDLYLPESLEYVGDYAFKEVNHLTGFYGNPEFITSDHRCLIRKYGGEYWIDAFAGEYVENYTIPSNIHGIQNYGLSGGVQLKSITFTSAIDVISAYSLYNCNNLEYFYGYGATSDNRGLCTDGTLLVIVPNGPKEYSTPTDVTSIGPQAFGINNNLESVTISDTVTNIGDYAFVNCPNLKRIVLSANLKTVEGYNPFMSCSNLEEIYFRSFMPPTYSDTQFHEEDFTHLTVYVPEETLDLYKKSDWYQFAPYMVGYHYDDIGEWNPDYYISTDQSHDGETIELQHSTVGEGINLVLMGDGFSDRQIADGTYDTVMRNAMNAFFSEEPYKSFKERFNVSYVNVVSMTEGYEHAGQALGTGFGDGTYVYGNDNKVIDYAKKAVPEERLDDALVIVMMNKDAYAGTCYMYYPTVSGDYGRGLSIAYFPTSSDTDTFNGLVSHEAGGHGFAKLGDEYAYESMGAVPSDVVSTTRDQASSWGWYKNIDFTGDPTQVKWSQFISDSRYVNENIGCYEGAFTYWTGAWRPTENSIMNNNTGGFNAPSRYAIWYRINKLAYGDNWNGTYEDFVAYDAVNRSPAAVQRRQDQVRRSLRKNLPPLAPPVVVKHSWREAE